MALAIAPFVVPAGTAVLGPVDTGGGWTHFHLLLDVANLTSLDAVAELSTDGGSSWLPLAAMTGLVPVVNVRTSRGFGATWDPPLPAGQLRITLTNSVAFASTGGSLVVT